jgi:hypothetical protein
LGGWEEEKDGGEAETDFKLSLCIFALLIHPFSKKIVISFNVRRKRE